MTEKKALTIEFAASVLKRRRLVTEAQYREILIKGEAQRARLRKSAEQPCAEGVQPHTRQHHPGNHPNNDPVTPAEVIASLGLPIDGSDRRLTEDTITEALAADTGIPYMKIDPLRLDLDVVTARIPRPFARRHLVVPVEDRGGVITLAVADPFDLEPLESLKNSGKMRFRVVLSSKTDILKIVREFFGFRYSVGAAEKEFAGAGQLGNLEQYVKLKGAVELEATDQHVVNAVEYLLLYAYDQRASDIHIEPKRESSLVRLRIDGVLHCIHTIPRAVHPSVASRIKMLSRMDIAERRKPQDGRIKTSFRDKEIELRVSTMPTAFGEKVVIRIFDPDVLFQELGGLGFFDHELASFTSFLKRKHGIILVTGPTGSGKTTTLYSALRHLSSPRVNIVTVEDPIEMIVDEFNQVGVQPQIGMDFAESLRTILRQDPDIIMVGEIRDRKTAENAVQAALTGHLVFSTLHTNDGPSTVVRLTDLGVPPFLINSTVIAVVAQRLVRKICAHCKAAKKLSDAEAASLGLVKRDYRVCYGQGCAQCRSTGYRGRTGVFEIMEFTDEVRSAVSRSPDAGLIREASGAQNASTLRLSAVKKMLQGVTTYEEVVSVT